MIAPRAWMIFVKLFMKIPLGTVIAAMLGPAFKALVVDGLVCFCLILVDRTVFLVVPGVPLVLAIIFVICECRSGGEQQD